jgi:hypothetical protein
MAAFADEREMKLAFERRFGKPSINESQSEAR